MLWIWMSVTSSPNDIPSLALFLNDEIYYHIFIFSLFPLHQQSQNMSFFYIQREIYFPFFSLPLRFYFFLLSWWIYAYAFPLKQYAKKENLNKKSFLSLLFRLHLWLNVRKQRNLFWKQYQSNENPNDLTLENTPPPPSPWGGCWHWCELTNFTFRLSKIIFGLI